MTQTFLDYVAPGHFGQFHPTQLDWMHCSGNNLSDKTACRRSGSIPTYRHMLKPETRQSAPVLQKISDLDVFAVPIYCTVTRRKDRRLLGGSWNQSTQSIQCSSDTGVL
jgi:hypothetical protein